jgi:hypothetical protein
MWSASACLPACTARATSGAEVQGRGGPHTASRLRLDPRGCGEGVTTLPTALDPVLAGVPRELPFRAG